MHNLITYRSKRVSLLKKLSKTVIKYLLILNFLNYLQAPILTYGVGQTSQLAIKCMDVNGLSLCRPIFFLLVSPQPKAQDVNLITINTWYVKKITKNTKDRRKILQFACIYYFFKKNSHFYYKQYIFLRSKTNT